MQHWSRKKGMMGDDPPFLSVGTEVSAKYKGAFCEAKVRKVVRSVKCKVTFKLGLGTAIITDDQIRGTLRVGSVCEVKHPDKKEFVEATINKIQDCSQYTVVFDDGDITTLRRTALCLKSGRHFAESETLDQLPLTHPEHFGNPVIGGRKGRRSRQTHDDSSDDEDTPRKGKKKEEKEADIRKVVCVELGDKKKQKDNWFPGLVVAPTAQDTVRIRVRDEYLVRSFKDGRYFTVPKKEATEFTREIGAKVDNNTLKAAVEKALLFLDRDELPPHWDRDLLFGMDETSGSDSDAGFDSDSSDDEPREEKDHFVAQLYKFMDDRGTPINKGPVIGNKDVDLYKLFKVVHKLGGFNRVSNNNQWKIISHKLGFGQSSSGVVRTAYKKFLHSFEDFYRKLGCTMVNHPRGNRSRHRSGRSLIRDRDRSTPINALKDKEKTTPVTASEKSSDTHDKEASQSDKKEELEKNIETEKKEKPEEPPKPREQKREKHKQKEEKTAEKEKEKEKEEKKSEKNKTKDTEISAEKTKSKEEKLKASEALKEEKEEKEDRLRSREPRKDDKGKESRSRTAVTVEDDSSNSKNEGETFRSRHVANPPVPVLSHPLPEESVHEDKTKVNEDKTKVKEEKTKAKDTKVKPKETKGKKEEKVKAPIERTRTREEKPEIKVKEEKQKIIEEEKIEEVKKKPDKKEEEEKQTRSKCKEELRPKKDTVTPDRRPSETKILVREPEKKVPIKPKKIEEEMVFGLKKRGRKRKDTDDKSKSEESLGQLASNISVGVGDKLKVYYGPTHESKVTYEAKVLDIEEDGDESVYLVHYTGWNTRYDEWIKRGRIADNLSWTPSRAKRLRHQQAQAQLKVSKPILGKRGRPSTGSRTQELPNTQQPPRSTTPSSVTSTSSRTKSPAASTSAARSSGSTRVTRNTDPNNVTPCRRTRRMSGHTDISMASETESEEYDSEPEIEPTQTRSRTEKKASLIEKEETCKDETPKEDTKKIERPFRRKIIKRKDEDDDEEDKDCPKEEDSLDLTPETEAPPEVTVSEKRRSKRTKKVPVTPIVEKKEDELKSESGVKQELGIESEEEQPKGRDFDLNQIRSELKGIEKAVKLPQDVVHRAEEKSAQITLDDKSAIVDSVRCKTEDKEVVQSPVKEEKVTEKVEEASTEDIYEFKEPEPFEFEVRTKRESVLSEDRVGKLHRRPPRIFDNIVEPKVEKSPSPRKKLVRSAVTKQTDNKDDVPLEGEVKKRFRRSLTKKVVPPCETKKSTVHTEEVQLSPMKSVQIEPVTPQKSRPLSACEEAFDKLCESPSFHVPTKSCETRIPSPLPLNTVKPLELEPLILFSELPGDGPDDDGEDDSEDRLVISETDETETETEEPLFTYPQRHHEELFPTLVSSSESVTAAPESTVNIDRLVPPKSSPEPPQLLPIGADIFTSFASGPEISRKTEEPLQREGESDGEKSHEQSAVDNNEDVMKLFLKSGDDDEYEDDPINAAIQRVIEQSMTDEESNDDMDIFGNKKEICNLGDLHQENSITTKQDSIPVEEPKKEPPPKEITTKRKSGGRKPVLSKEFVEDTDTDSDSDEEERLVIAKIDEDDDNVSSSSSQCSLKLHVSESSDFEMKLRLSDRDDDSKTEGEEGESKMETKDEKVVDTKSEAEACVNLEAIESVTVVKTVTEDTVSSQNTEPQMVEDAVILEAGKESAVAEKAEEESVEETVPVTVEKVEESSGECEKCEGESDSNMRSLLCEETIPGSPAPVTDSAQVAEPCSEEQDEKTPVLEMPFASAPGNNCSSSTNNSINNGKTIPIFVSSPVVDPPTSPPPMAVEISEPVRIQTIATSNSSNISPPLPPQVQVQAPLPLPVPVSVAGPGPGSGVSSPGLGPGVSKRNSNEAAPVMDNTPPTTPDSSLSTISGSPREERDGMSPTMDNESSKSHRDSFEIDTDGYAEGNKDHFSEEDSLLNIEVSNSSENRLQTLKLLPKKPCSDLDKELESSPKKRRRSRKRSECESNKRSRHSSGRSTRNIGSSSSGGNGGGGGGSDSDDTSENSTAGGCTPLTSSENVLSSRSPRPSKYNFYVELDPELDGTQRIALLQQKLQELRKTYMNVKAELACIDRRRKKLRRREREGEIPKIIKN